ncbi:MAG: ATP-binding protein, partial [Tannerella sp.]|nr:ATP-binding protein [Tannerella sp.]
MKRFSHNWGLLIAWWGLLTAALALVLYNRLWFAAALLILFWLPALHKLLKLYRRQARKVSFMFDAIDNADQAFRFAESGGSLTDRQVNASLNRIIKILFQAKADAMQQEKYYELILDSVNTGILAIDDQGRI